MFSGLGKISPVKVMADKFSDGSKGCGFVEMPDNEAARKAIAELNGPEAEGRPNVVNEAGLKKERL